MDSPFRILHLENDVADTERVEAALREAGMHPQITRVQTREQFLEKLKCDPFELILADYMLPGFEGPHALAAARQACNPQPPFIFFSGALGEEVAAEAIRLGAIDYVLKNRIEHLPQAIKRAMREAEEHRQRQLAEDALRVSDQRFRAMAEALPQIVWETDLDGRALYMNARWYEYTGIPLEEVADRWPGLIHPDDREQTVASWRHCLATGESLRIENRIRRKDGEYRWFLSWGLPRRDDAGRVTGWLGTSTDIHDHKRAEEQLRELNEELEQRVQQRTRTLVDHQEQLRAMASDLTLTEHRERRRLAVELHDYLAQLLVACRMKTRLVSQSIRSPRSENVVQEINDLLEQCLKYTRTLIAELSPTILYESGLVAAVQWLAEQMQRYGVHVEVLYDGAPVQLHDDHLILTFQAIRELLINVAKHAMVHEASVTIERSVDNCLVVTVEDAGSGFDSSSDAVAVSGKYGLFSVRERLEVLGAHLEVQSRPGEGTRASLRVPLTVSEEAEIPAFEAPSSVSAIPDSVPSSPRRRVTRVLLADDHQIVREGLRSLIDSEPRLRVVGEASNGEEVLLQARQLHPDVIVMDINMPRMNGIEATRQLKQEFPEVAVIALSMHEDRSVIALMREAGAVAYILKGGAPEQLSRAIREAHTTVAAT